MEEDAGYLVPNRMNNNSQKELLAVEEGYLVPTSPGFQVKIIFGPQCQNFPRF